MKHSLFFISSFLVLFFSCNSELHQDKTLTDVYSLSDDENAFARSNYSNLRLMNPATGVIPNSIMQLEYDFIQTKTKKKAASLLEWQSKGPINVGGRSRALALDVLNENRILVGGVSGGIWLSENGGASFSKLTTSLMLHSVTCIAQDTRAGKQNIWYYGTGELSGNSADLIGHGLYKSVDNGLTWNLLQSTSNDSSNIISPLGDFAYVSDIKVNPINGDLMVATFAGIFLSQDGGDSWVNVLAADNSPSGFGYVNFGNQTSVDVSSQGVYYACLSVDAQDKGIWRSADGLNWTLISPTGLSSAYRRIESGINPLNENEVLFIVDATTNATVDNHELWQYTYVSGDGSATGGTWLNKSSNLPNGDCLGFYDFNFGFYQSQNSYDMFIKYHPSQANVVFLGGTNLYRSSDAFNSASYDWIGGYQCDALKPSNYVWPHHHPDNHAIVFIPSNPNSLISAHDGGLSFTENCLSNAIVWSSLNNGYSSSQFYTVAIEPGATTNEMIMGGLQDNGTWLTSTHNPTQAWKQTFYGDGAYAAIAEGRTAFYVSWQGGKTFKFDIDDQGNTTALTRIDPIGGSDYLFINPFILDPNNSNTMYLAAGNFIWKNDSLDAIPLINDEYNAISQGWTKILQSTTANLFTTVNYISALEMSEANSDVLYYGTYSGSLFKLSGLQTGTILRESIKRSNLPSGAYVSCIETNPSDENEIMLTYSNYEVKSIFHSLDGGLTWTNISGSLEENPDGSGAGPSVNWAHIYQDETDSLYLVGTTSGLFVTRDLNADNTVWTREAEEQIGNVPVTMITSRTFDKNIVVSTHGAGVFSTKIVEVGIVDEALRTREIDLRALFPNPSNHMMNVKLHLTNDQSVTLNILDIQGKKVMTMNSLRLEKGMNQVNINTRDLQDGMYYLQVEDGKSNSSLKFLVQH